MKYYLGIWCIAVLLFFGIMGFAAVPNSYAITYITTDKNQNIVSEERCYVWNNTKMRIELIEEGELVEIGLYHKDRKAWYTLYPACKRYSLHRLKDSDWDLSQRKANIANLGKKTGQTRYLGLICDIYEKKTGDSSITSVVSREYGLIVKIINQTKGKTVSQTVAKEFNMVTPDEALFEFKILAPDADFSENPDGYIDSNYRS